MPINRKSGLRTKGFEQNIICLYKILIIIVQLVKLQAAIKYEMDDVDGCKRLIDQCPPEEPDTMINQACLLFKVSIRSFRLGSYYR